ncbi:hypothetical protein Q4E40_05445 [Pontibacter sp. BT731]|uniref:hypothetical protein n=1 Tax=Pontibacter coccineus TaxID=3063328 RepID=UPI0026E20A72|nr:hypothetical protein [Pontibacter sp. BT731]MDO6389560.1 hypothetical protein [Pontibacter sp. BT731]
MKTKPITRSQWRSALSRPLFLFILSFTLALTGCEKSKDTAQPFVVEPNTSQAQDARKDDDYKRNKTGQYVSKDVQVIGYDDGSVRPTRPKFDVTAGEIGSRNVVPCDPCDGGGGSVLPPVFLTSEGLGAVSSYPSGYIYALRLIVGTSSSIQPSEGHIKINTDLNKGAGGKYIYLTFTRDPQYAYENYISPVNYTTPITDLMAVSYSQVCYTFNGYLCNANPWNGWVHMFTFNGTYSQTVDLNDGVGGKYIFGHVYRETSNGRTPIKEVGIISGNTSNITPPSGWIKYHQDLNEGAGGDYIYLCFKR